MINLSENTEKFAEKVLDETTKYDGHIIRAAEQTVLLPDGRQTKRDIVYHSDAIAILALTKDNKMILEKQWRAPVQQLTLEIPAGKIDNRDQNPLDAVNRELNEETRLFANNIEEITGFYTSIGFSDEYMTLYLATDLEPVAKALPQDDDEQIDLIYADYEQATELFNSGQLKDSKTNLAYLYWRTLQ